MTDALPIQNTKSERHDPLIFLRMALPRHLLFVDTETTGKILYGSGYNVDLNRLERGCHLVQLSWELVDTQSEWQAVVVQDFVVHPGSLYSEMPTEAHAVHGISYDHACTEGTDMYSVLSGPFLNALMRCDALVAHNASFDIKVILSSAYRSGLYEQIHDVLSVKDILCTKNNLRAFCDARDRRGRRKAPRLGELYHKVFGRDMENAHNALYDVKACIDVVRELHQSITWRVVRILPPLTKGNNPPLHPPPTTPMNPHHLPPLEPHTQG